MDKADPLYSSYIINIVFNAFSAYTAIVLNILTIHAIRKTSSLPKPLKTLLLSLAVSDLGVGLLAQPLTIAWMADPTYVFTEAALNFTAVIFVYASLFTVVAISVDRFLAVHLHLRYQELVTHKRVVAAVISIWTLSAFLSAIAFSRAVRIIKIIDMSIQGLCIVCTTIVYCRIYSAVRRHTNQIRALQVQQVEVSGEITNLSRQAKSAVSTLYVYFVFLICFLPNYFPPVLFVFSAPSTALVEVSLYTWTLVLVNSSLNPVIYCWKMRHIRQSIKDILQSLLPSQNN